nr:unnamed protein product [Callosobruchus chinensis]
MHEQSTSGGPEMPLVANVSGSGSVPDKINFKYPAVRTSTTFAGIQNHSQVCQHRTNPLVNAQIRFSCGNCSATFPAQLGLSEHKRHVHPSVRNQERIASAAATRKRTIGERTNRPKIWTDEKEQRLCELKEVYRGKCYINKLLMSDFPGKTSKQR